MARQPRVYANSYSGSLTCPCPGCPSDRRRQAVGEGADGRGELGPTLDAERERRPIGGVTWRATSSYGPRTDSTGTSASRGASPRTAPCRAGDHTELGGQPVGGDPGVFLQQLAPGEPPRSD